jgi:hypothetical protein
MGYLSEINFLIYYILCLKKYLGKISFISYTIIFLCLGIGEIFIDFFQDEYYLIHLVLFFV